LKVDNPAEQVESSVAEAPVAAHPDKF